MAIRQKELFSDSATVLAEDGSTMYATIQMRHGKESEMDKSKFVPAEMGVATDTKKAFMAFAPGEVKEIMFREDSEIEELLEEVRDISDQAVEAVESAEASAKQAIEDYTEQMKATIPEDYTEMVKKVDMLERTKAPAIYQTVSGESLQIEDSADAPISGLRVFGKSRQVKTTGAQLLDVRNNISNNITTTSISFSGDGELIINGTANREDGNDDIYLVGNWGDETILYSGVNTVTIYGLTKDENIYLINNVNSLQGIGEESISRSDGITAIAIRLKKGKNYNDFRIRPMLNAGSSALPWEPYTGGKPSPSPDYPQEIEIPGSEGNVAIENAGANLIKYPYLTSSITNNGIQYNVEEGNIIANGTASGESILTIYSLPFKKGKNYYLQGCPKNGSIDTYCLEFGNGGGRDIGNGAEYSPTLDGITNINIRIRNGVTVNNLVFHPMLSEGSSALPWEPYKHQSITIATPNGLPGIPVDSGGNYTDESGQQWVCDEVDFKRGKYVQRVKKLGIDDFTIDSNIGPGTTGARFTAIVPDRIKKPGQPALCNYFPFNNVSSYNSEGNYIATDETQRVFIRVTDDITLEEFKQTYPDLVAYYQLDTPIETDLSEEELTAYAALRTNYPTTVVTSDSDPEVGIEVEYVADTQKYIDNKFAELAQNLAATQNTLLEV